MTVKLPERLQTPRLVLRQPRRDDASLLFNGYTQDSEVVRYLIWRPHQSLGQTQDFIEYCMRVWSDGNGRPYILARHDDEDAPIGMLDARIQSHMVDIGYVLKRSEWGEGLMPEALDAVSGAALEHPECFRVQASCGVANVASARVLEKSGFIREGRLERHAVLPNIAPEPGAFFMYARCR